MVERPRVGALAKVSDTLIILTIACLAVWLWWAVWHREKETKPSLPKSQEENADLLWNIVSLNTGPRPKTLNINDEHHRQFAVEVAGDYGQVLENKGAWSKCLFYPESILPYPKSVIYQALTTLLTVGFHSRNIPASVRHDLMSMRDTIDSCLIYLEDALPLNADLIPTDSRKNLSFGLHYRSLEGGSEEENQAISPS